MFRAETPFLPGAPLTESKLEDDELDEGLLKRLRKKELERRAKEREPAKRVWKEKERRGRERTGKGKCPPGHKMVFGKCQKVESMAEMIEIIEAEVRAELAEAKFELFHSTGEHGGLYNEIPAKRTAERLLKGGRDAWIAVMPAFKSAKPAEAGEVEVLCRKKGWTRAEMSSLLAGKLP